MESEVFKRAQAHVATTAGIRDELVADREKLVRDRAELGVRISEYDKLIAALTPGGASEEKLDAVDEVTGGKPTRLHGVKKIVEGVVRDLHLTSMWSKQDAIVEAVAKADQRVQGKSVVSALGRLVDEGVLIREGKRGSYRYALATIVPTTHDEEPAMSPPELILGKLKTSGPDGATKKDLSWLIGDVTLLDQTLDRLIADGEVRVVGSGASETFALAERVQRQRPLFEGAADASAGGS